MNKCKNNECNEFIVENRIYCSLKCRNVYVNKNLRDYSHYILKNAEKKHQYELNPKYCIHCNNEIIFKNRNNKYCSRSCGTTHSNLARPKLKYNKRSAEAIENIRLGNIKRSERCRQQYYTNPSKCCICSIPLTFEHKGRKTCSDECFRIHTSNNMSNNPNCGGETNYKKYKYNNVTMDSSWEVDIAKWFDENNINWVREKINFFRWIDSTNKKRRYHPDFYLPEYNIYIDTKNSYLIEKDKEKIEFVKTNYNINLIVGNVEFIKQQLLSSLKC